MKKILLMALLSITLMLTSCTFGIADVVVTPTNPSPTTSKTITKTTSDGNTPLFTTPIVTPLVIKDKQDLLKATSDLVYPAVIQFNNYIAGVNIQSWYLDDKTPVFGHNMGDVMCIEIYNANDYNAVFSIQYSDIPYPTTYSDGTTLYQSEPRAANWVTIAHPIITLEPHQLLGIPISLDVPVGTVCPPDWEFRITVQDKTNMSMINTQMQCRVLVHMMQP